MSWDAKSTRGHRRSPTRRDTGGIGQDEGLVLEFSMTDEFLFSYDFLAALSEENPDFNYIRGRVIRAYNSATNNELEETLSGSDDRLSDVAQWLNQLLMSDDQRASFHIKKPVLLAAFSSDLSSKFNSLSQFHCPVCKGGFPVAVIPIRIRPISYQASDAQTKRAFKKAIGHRLSKSHDYRSKQLCVHTTFVVGTGSRKKDVDNMAKILLDGLQGQILDNDSQIDHLSLLRLTWNGNEEYLSINIRESNINRHDDVLHHKMNHSWAGEEELILDRFMDDT